MAKTLISPDGTRAVKVSTEADEVRLRWDGYQTAKELEAGDPLRVEARQIRAQQESEQEPAPKARSRRSKKED